MKKPKALKVFLWGERMKDVYPFATKLQVFKYKAMKFLRKVVQYIIASLVISGIAIGIFMYAVPNKVVVNQITIEEKADYPVLDRIAKCESGNRHFGESGQVLVMGNTNKSVDIGRYQINNVVWGKKATELGLDLMKEKDNRTMAEYIYKNFGTEPWVYSKHCWNK